jgi:hypothetical protein
MRQHHRERFSFAPSSIQMRIALAPIVKMAIWFQKRSTKLVSAIWLKSQKAKADAAVNRMALPPTII